MDLLKSDHRSLLFPEQSAAVAVESDGGQFAVAARYEVRKIRSPQTTGVDWPESTGVCPAAVRWGVKLIRQRSRVGAGDAESEWKNAAVPGSGAATSRALMIKWGKSKTR